MKALQRQEEILRILNEKGHTNALQLSSVLGVSEVTIRRDFDALEASGFIRRIYGGAMLYDSQKRGVFADKLLFNERASVNQDKKEAIARCAAKLVHEQEAIFLDIGTTITALANAISGMSNIVALTNSLSVMNILSSSLIKLYSVGGAVNTSELSITGDVATSFVQDFNIDNAFISASGITPESGMSEYLYETSQLRKAIIVRAKKVTLLADSSKFGKNCFSVVAPLSAVTTIITDSGLDEQYTNSIHEMGIELIFADE